MVLQESLGFVKSILVILLLLRLAHDLLFTDDPRVTTSYQVEGHKSFLNRPLFQHHVRLSVHSSI